MPPEIRQNAGSSVVDRAQLLAWEITGEFEGGRTDSLQTQDSGIVSYGKFQATLTSGSLEAVLDEYLARTAPENTLAQQLREYLPRVSTQDETLRTDSQFHQLLKRAAKSSVMDDAQNVVFADRYWRPIAKIAERLGIQSDIGKAILFDTKVQGGLDSIIRELNQESGTANIDERGKLESLLELRRDYLLDVAERKENAGDSQTARYLRTAASSRIRRLFEWLDASMPQPQR